MNKIKKWLKENNISITYIGAFRYENSGGRSFNNDGTYTTEEYSVDNTDYTIKCKTSGRKEFYLYKNEDFTVFSTTQTNFVDEIKKILVA